MNYSMVGAIQATPFRDVLDLMDFQRGGRGHTQRSLARSLKASDARATLNCVRNNRQDGRCMSAGSRRLQRERRVLPAGRQSKRRRLVASLAS